MEQCFTTLGNLQTAQWVLEGDIKSCFDGISHEWLLTHIPIEKAILRKRLKAGYMEKNIPSPTEEGTPQGGILSPVLANRTLDGLERRQRECSPKTTVKGIAAKVNFVRYADDFIVTAASSQLLEQEVKPLVEAFLEERGLKLSSEKTCITHIEVGGVTPYSQTIVEVKTLILDNTQLQIRLEAHILDLNASVWHCRQRQ